MARLMISFCFILCSIQFAFSWVTWINREISPCYKNYCKNGADCVQVAQSSAKCICGPEQYGDRCQIELRKFMGSVDQPQQCYQTCTKYSCDNYDIIDGDKCILKTSNKTESLIKTGQLEMSCPSSDPVPLPVMSYTSFFEDHCPECMSENSTGTPRPTFTCTSNNTDFNLPDTVCPWRAEDLTQDLQPWLEINFEQDYIVTGLSIKSWLERDERVRSIKLVYFDSKGGPFSVTDEENRHMLIPVFYDRNATQFPNNTWTYDLLLPVILNKLRVTIIEYHNHPTLRLQVNGCPFKQL